MNPTTQRQFVVLAGLEGLVVLSAVARIVLGAVDLERPAHLGWLLATLLTAGSALALFVVRAIAVERRGGPDAGDARRQTLALALSVLVLAGLLSAAGPELVAGLLGG